MVKYLIEKAKYKWLAQENEAFKDELHTLLQEEAMLRDEKDRLLDSVLGTALPAPAS